jgi:hypothetical protein
MTKHQSEPNAQPASEKRITEGVRDMLAILEDPEATEDEKARAASTIVEAVAPDIMEAATKEAQEWWDGKAPAAPAGEREEVERLRARLAEIEAGANADAEDLAKLRDGTKLTRAGVVQVLVWQQQELAEAKATNAALQAKLDAVAGLVKKWRGWSRGIGKSPVAAQWAYTRCADELEAALAE